MVFSILHNSVKSFCQSGLSIDFFWSQILVNACSKNTLPGHCCWMRGFTHSLVLLTKDVWLRTNQGWFPSNQVCEHQTYSLCFMYWRATENCLCSALTHKVNCTKYSPLNNYIEPVLGCLVQILIDWWKSQEDFYLDSICKPECARWNIFNTVMCTNIATLYWNQCAEKEQ